MAATQKTETIEIKPIEMTKVQLTLIGDSPLIMHAWSEKAKRMMLEKQTGKSKGKQVDFKNPVDDFVQSMYWIEGKPEYSDKADDVTCQKAFEAAIAKGVILAKID